MNDKLISICITSYNRPKELRRCLESIDASATELIEIIVSEDLSPKREEIKKVICKFKASSKYSIIDNYNINNLGYDRNLEKLVNLATGKYVLFCSDDDAFNFNVLNEIIQYLRKKKEIPMLYTAFTNFDKFSANRFYNKNFIIKPGLSSANKYIYDGILFSGLIFNRDLIKDFSAEKFVNLNYYQIYLLLKVVYHYGAHYLKSPLINCIADGVNGYGTTELSNKDNLLANRNSIYSNLQFNKGLVETIKIFDKEEKTNLLSKFSKEYSLRSYRGLSKARKISRSELLKYWNFLKCVGVKMSFVAYIYFILLYVTNAEFCDKIIIFPKKILFKIRGYK